MRFSRTFEASTENAAADFVCALDANGFNIRTWHDRIVRVTVETGQPWSSAARAEDAEQVKAVERLALDLRMIRIGIWVEGS